MLIKRQLDNRKKIRLFRFCYGGYQVKAKY